MVERLTARCGYCRGLGYTLTAASNCAATSTTMERYRVICANCFGTGHPYIPAEMDDQLPGRLALSKQEGGQ